MMDFPPWVQDVGAFGLLAAVLYGVGLFFFKLLEQKRINDDARIALVNKMADALIKIAHGKETKE